MKMVLMMTRQSLMSSLANVTFHSFDGAIHPEFYGFFKLVDGNSHAREEKKVR